MIQTIIYAVLVLGALIFFHELGHFAVARWFGMGVSRFSLGFGPILCSFTKGKTQYALSAVPLGGYVSLVGESDDAELPEGFSPQESFALRPAWQRLLVVAAGPIANFVLAWFVCWVLAIGYGQVIALPEIGGIVAESPAAKAGIQTGDRVLAVDDTPIGTWAEMSDAIAASKGKSLTFLVQRGTESLPVTLTPQLSKRKTIFGEEEEAWLAGVRSSGAVETLPLSFAESFPAANARTWELIDLTWQGFVKLAQRVVPADQVGGPIMIAQMVGQSAEAGLAALLALTALISVNLGILNLLPVPILDGGQIVFCLVEMVIRRPINETARGIAMRVGFALLMALMVFATYNDIVRIVKSWSVG
ncbi:MAG: RIP metalloprotease RseP [Desulfovibrionaceae bacterium]|nr:RIP metalloprotease RseP [Desulfovibrionaceae bacterium]